MKNISNKNCRKSQNTHLVSSIFFFSKITMFMRLCGKVWYSQTGRRCQYNWRRKDTTCVQEN